MCVCTYIYIIILSYIIYNIIIYNTKHRSLAQGWSELLWLAIDYNCVHWERRGPVSGGEEKQNVYKLYSCSEPVKRAFNTHHPLWSKCTSKQQPSIKDKGWHTASKVSQYVLKFIECKIFRLLLLCVLQWPSFFSFTNSPYRLSHSTDREKNIQLKCWSKSSFTFMYCCVSLSCQFGEVSWHDLQCLTPFGLLWGLSGCYCGKPRVPSRES